ncbi:hypothetical protein D3C75_989160 [compost metagenome]
MHRITEQDIVASPAIELVGPWQVVDGGAQDGIGQIVGRHVGLHNLVAIELFQGSDRDIAANTDGLQDHVIGRQQWQHGQRILQCPIIVVVRSGDLEGTITLGTQSTDRSGAPFAIAMIAVAAV